MLELELRFPQGYRSSYFYFPVRMDSTSLHMDISLVEKQSWESEAIRRSMPVWIFHVPLHSRFISLADPHYMAPVALRFDGSYTFWHHSRIRLLEPSTVQPQWHGRPDSLGCISSPSRSGFWLCRVLLPLPSTKRRLYHSRN